MRYAVLAATLAGGLIWTAPMSRADHLDCTVPETQPERNQCALANYENAYRVLRALWSEAMIVAGRLDEDLAPEDESATVVLYDAQNRWLAYSERACEAEGLLRRGEDVQSLVYYNCMLRLTEERMGSLMAFVGEGADAAGADVHVHDDGTTHLHYD